MFATNTSRGTKIPNAGGNIFNFVDVLHLGLCGHQITGRGNTQHAGLRPPNYTRIAEAWRTSWVDYVQVFRQQAAIDHTIQWNTLHPGIQAATLVGQGPGTSIFCTQCREPDHTADHCALTYLRQPTLAGTPNNPASTRPRPRPGRHPESLLGICVSWNKGRCVYPGTCTFRHVCVTCHQNHMA